MKITYLSLFFLSLFLMNCSSVKELSLDESFLSDKKNFMENFGQFKAVNGIPQNTKIRQLQADHSAKSIILELSRDVTFIPFREDNVEQIYSNLKSYFGKNFSEYDFSIISGKYEIDELIPNLFRTIEKDESRLPLSSSENRIPLVRNDSKDLIFNNGLRNKNILLWHSHGWYYNNNEKRWMWQRARLFQAVEDTGPLSFTIPFLIPMLENSGATVFVPRERDPQINEVIVDNDFSGGEFYIENAADEFNWRNSDQAGFGFHHGRLRENENPFLMGTGRVTISDIKETATVRWIPLIPETGDYSVYISYQSFHESVSDAHYEVMHSGGITKFHINQQLGGNTWVYLGTFRFNKGSFEDQGVLLSNRGSTKGSIVSADAVRFGGGMGVVEREGQISGRAKFFEGSRYWLQFAGMTDTLIYDLSNGTDDYKDDYQSRAEYGNYLFGSPFGPNKDRTTKGLKIPLDVSLAFHTDAGITRNDTVIGTLMIYSTPGMDSLHSFPDGVSRLANRDLADIVQSQIVSDLRALYDSAWSRRQLMDALYSEAVRPNFPSMLLELLSHQNFLDMKFHLDPRFRFDASRAIYKGILKFLAVQYGFEPVVQPLPVTHFAAVLKNNNVHLSWKPQDDPLEPSATSDKYILYTRIDDRGFDNGIIIGNNNYELDEIEPGRIYSFKVTALNSGGESFPSEILSVGLAENNPEPFLIVNGFDRVAPPHSIQTEKFTGFLNFIDEGVPYKYDYGFTGIQFNFDPESEWLTDDNPGHGASASDFETAVIAGNTFDYPYIHGSSILANGFSFCSVSDESVWDSDININSYRFVDFIFGEEKKTDPPKSDNNKKIEFEVLPEKLRTILTAYLNNGGNVFLSGSYIGSDLYDAPDSSGILFANDVLKFKLMTGHAARTGEIITVPFSSLRNNFAFRFNTDFNDSIYKVEAPDEIGPVNGSEILFRYSENNFSAGVGYRGNYGAVVFGFPFETVLEQKDRDKLMSEVLKYLHLK